MSSNTGVRGQKPIPNDDCRDNVEFLVSCLEHPDLRTRLAAIENLSRACDERAILPLLSLLRDRWGQNVEVRLAALRCLSLLLEEDESADLLEDFVQGDSPRLMAAARKLLKQKDPGRYAARLARRECLDAWSINSYGRGRESGAVTLLVGFLQDGIHTEKLTSARSWGRMAAAIKALGSIGGPRAREVLETTREALIELEEEDSLRVMRKKELLRVLGESMDSLESV